MERTLIGFSLGSLGSKCEYILFLGLKIIIINLVVIISSYGTINPGVTWRQDNPLKGIRNIVPQKPDNHLRESGI